ncbi:hypothetical protein ES705_44159 [subsurface metagenome]
MQARAFVNRWVWGIKEIATCRKKERQEAPHPRLPASATYDAQNKLNEIPVVCLGQALISGVKVGCEWLRNGADTIGRMDQSVMVHIAQRYQDVNNTLFTLSRSAQIFL